jgi:hypothetical protein
LAAVLATPGCAEMMKTPTAQNIAGLSSSGNVKITEVSALPAAAIYGWITTPACTCICTGAMLTLGKDEIFSRMAQ